MKKLLGVMICLCLGVVLSMGATGCQPTKDGAKKAGKGGDGDKEKGKGETGKEAGTSKDKDKDKDKNIEVAADPKEMKVDPGKSASAALKITRGKEAKADVTFTVAVAPVDKGVKAHADKGDYTVTVTAKSDGAKDVETKVMVKVDKKETVVEKDKDMKLEIAKGDAVKVKQGEKKEEKIAVTLGKDLKAATVKAEVKGPKDGKGVAAKVTDKLEKSGNATVTITVADDATEGEWTVTITAAGEGAMPASADTKITVTVEKKKG
jgi:hypothetical protein